MEDPDQGYAIAMEPVDRAVQCVNLEEKGQKLFKIAQNSEQNQANNLKEFNEELKGLKKEEVTKLCQTKDDKENTVLHYAAKAGNLTVCQILVFSGADINATGQNGMKVLPFAARYGDEKKANEVWACMSWIASEITGVVPALPSVPAVVAEPAMQRISSLLSVRKKESPKMPPKEEKDITFGFFEKDKYNFSVLHHAIQNTNWVTDPVVVRNLISTQKFPITETDNQGNTCLHLAAQLDKLSDDKIFDVFFNNKHIPAEDISACISTKNDRGMTPVHIACAVGNHDSLEELLKACKRNHISLAGLINEQDKSGLLPLCHAITSKNLKIVDALLNEGAVVMKGSMLSAAR